MQALIVLLILLATLVISVVLFKMKNIFRKLFLLAPLFFLIIFSSHFFTIIDAGEVGVQVMFGKIIQTTLQEGINVKIPFVDVYKYSIRLKEYTMSIVRGEGAMSRSDAITARTKDNSEIIIDATVWYKINETKAYDIYRKIAKSETEIDKILIRPGVRTTIRDEVSQYELSEIFQKRKEFSAIIRTNLQETLEDKGIIIEKVLIREMRPPKLVDEAIERKLKRQQELQEMESRKKIAQKQKEIKIIEAEGLREAQKIINSTLTRTYLQHEAIEAYKELANSNNTTFIIMPTDANATGIPIILQPNK